MIGSISDCSHSKIHSISRVYFMVFLCVILVVNFVTLNYALAQGYGEKEVKLPVFSLKSLEGETIENNDLAGKVVVIDFWATWCAPCIKSFPALVEAENSFKEIDEVIFLYVNTLESATRDEAFIQDFLVRKGIDIQVYMDDSSSGKPSFSDRLNITALPHKLIVDKSGIIRHRITGFSGSDEELINDLTGKINELLD